MNPNILLADDHSMVRKGIQMLCKLNFGYAPADEVSSCRELMERLAGKKYTHLVLDINLSDGNTLEVIPSIKRLYPNLQIAILSMQPESIYRDLLRRHGIYQFISKTAPEDQTFRLLQDFFENALASQLEPETSGPTPFSKFTRRELEILHLLLEGKGTSEIANVLDLKHNTVSTVKNRIFEKTKISNMMELKELASIYKID